MPDDRHPLHTYMRTTNQRTYLETRWIFIAPPSRPVCLHDETQVYAPRLSKMFKFFAVGGGSTVPRLEPSQAQALPPASGLPLKKTNPEADRSDTSESSDSWSSSSEEGEEEEDRDGVTGATGGDGSRTSLEVLQPQGNVSVACNGPFRKRKPRPPAMREKERRLSAREFVGMLRSLGVRG